MDYETSQYQPSPDDFGYHDLASLEYLVRDLYPMKVKTSNGRYRHRMKQCLKAARVALMVKLLSDDT